jgi:hypothetical protein
MNCLCRGLSAGRAVSGLDLAALDAELTALAKVDSAVAARRSLVAAEVKRRRSDPADRLTKAGGMSSREANRAAKTAEGLEKLSKTREALAAGEMSKGQAEQLASRMNKPALAKHVRANEEALLERARGESTDEFARTMRQDDLDGSPDGGNTQARCQRRARMASMWIDPDTGMHHLFAKFDPVTGARVSTRFRPWSTNFGGPRTWLEASETSVRSINAAPMPSKPSSASPPAQAPAPAPARAPAPAPAPAPARAIRSTRTAAAPPTTAPPTTAPPPTTPVPCRLLTTPCPPPKLRCHPLQTTRNCSSSPTSTFSANNSAPARSKTALRCPPTRSLGWPAMPRSSLPSSGQRANRCGSAAEHASPHRLKGWQSPLAISAASSATPPPSSARFTTSPGGQRAAAPISITFASSVQGTTP